MPSMPGTIGLFLRSSDNDYQQRLKELGVREAKRQGFEIVIESAMNDPAKQVEQIRAAVALHRIDRREGRGPGRQ